MQCDAAVKIPSDWVDVEQKAEQFGRDCCIAEGWMLPAESLEFNGRRIAAEILLPTAPLQDPGKCSHDLIC